MKRLTLFCFLFSVFCAQARITKFHNIYTPDGFNVLNTKVDSSGTNVTLKWLTDTNSPHYTIWRDGIQIAEVSNTNDYTDDSAISNYVHQYSVTTAYRDAGRPVATLSRFETNLAAGELDYVKDQVIVSNSWYLVATNKILKVTTPGLAVRTSNTFTNDYRTNACRIAYLTTTEGGGGGGEDTKTHKLYVLFDNVNRIVINEVDPDTLAYTTVVSNISATGTATTKGLCVGGAFLFVGISDVNHSYIYKYDLTDNFSVTTNQLADLALLTTIEYASDNVLAVGQDSGGLNWGARIAADDLTYDDVIGVGPAFGSARTIGDEIALNGVHFWAAYTNGGVSFFPNTDDSFSGYDPEEYNYVSSDFTNGLSVQNAGDYVWALFGTNAQNYSRQVLFTPTSGTASPGTNYLQPVREYTGAAGGGYVSQVTSDPTNDSMFYVAYPAAPTKLGLWSETVVDDTGLPTASFLAPAENALVSGTTNIIFRVSDGVMLSHSELRVYVLGEWVLLSTIYHSGTNVTNTVAWDTTTVFNGYYSLDIRAWDAAGNFSGFLPLRGVIVSNYNPNPGTMVWASNIVHGLSGTPQNEAVSIAFSGDNLVVGGKFVGSASFTGTNITSAGKNDIWFGVYTTNGVRQTLNVYTNQYDAQLRSLDVDGSQNIVICGYFENTLNLGTTNLTAGNLGPDSYDIFLAKYDSDGDPQWSRRLGGGSGSNYGRKVKADPSGNVLLVGDFYATANFGGTNISSAVGATDIFLSKYSSSGAFQWHKVFTSSPGFENSKGVLGLAVDGDGSSYVVGRALGNIDFGNGLSTSAGGADGWIAKINSSGALVWATMLGGSFDDVAESVCVSGTNVFVAGSFRGSITLGDSTYSSFSSDSSSLYLVRLSTNSGAILQSRVTGGLEPGISITPRAIAVDSDGHIVLHGAVSGFVDFGNGVATDGLGNLFVVKYNSAFQCLWFKRPYSTGFCGGYGLVIDGGRAIYGVGRWAGTGTFDGLPLSSINTSAVDGYLFKSSP